MPRDHGIEIGAQAGHWVKLRLIQHDLSESLPGRMGADQQWPHRLSRRPVLGGDVAVEHDPADERGRSDVERSSQGPQRIEAISCPYSFLISGFFRGSGATTSFVFR
jgi:hypothetical protein